MSDESSGADATGSFKLPASFLVEMDLPIHSGNDVDPSRFFVKNVGVYAGGFTVVVGYQPASGDAVDVATALVPRSTHVTNTTYALGGIGDFADSVGKVVVGRLDEIDAQPAGSFDLTLETGRIDPDCIRPMLRGVTGLLVSSGTEVSERLFGDVELVALENFQITPVVVSGQDPRILFSAIKGEGLDEECVCEGDTVGPPIRRINGIPPTASGDFTLLGNTCLELEGVDNGIRLKDVCSEPCCGCKELETVTRELERFGGQHDTLANFLSRLEASVSQFDAVVLGSRIGDRGCIQCE